MFARLLLSSLLCLAASAQVLPPDASGVSMGHLHLLTADPAAQKHFWISVIGAQPVTFGEFPGCRMPGAIILFRPGKPSAGSDGSVINHVGVKVRNLTPYIARAKAENLRFEVDAKARRGMAWGPDGVKVEITEDTALPSPLVFHHIHFYVPQPLDMQAWYAKTYGATPGKRGPFDAADLPGVNLSFSPIAAALPPTRGRALDHIGFEVKNLEEFCKKLEAAGIHFDVPYTRIANLKLSIAFFTDPWGVYTELTEGLDQVR